MLDAEDPPEIAVTNEQEEDSFDNELNEVMGHATEIARGFEHINIRSKLENLQILSTDLTICVWKYWLAKKDEDPQIYRLATAIHSIPPTQTTVERAFSTLSIVMNSRRSRLSDQSLQNILLVKLNAELYEKAIQLDSKM